MVLSFVCIVGGRRSSASSGGRRSSVAVAAATRARAELLADAWFSTQNFKEDSWEYLWYFDTQVDSTYRKRWLLEVSEDPVTIAGWVHPAMVTGSPWSIAVARIIVRASCCQRTASTQLIVHSISVTNRNNTHAPVIPLQHLTTSCGIHLGPRALRSDQKQNR
jgi:hypothetical protein